MTMNDQSAGAMNEVRAGMLMALRRRLASGAITVVTRAAPPAASSSGRSLRAASRSRAG
jgi:hypothetical protein